MNEKNQCQLSSYTSHQEGKVYHCRVHNFVWEKVLKLMVKKWWENANKKEQKLCPDYSGRARVRRELGGVQLWGRGDFTLMRCNAKRLEN